MGWNTIERGDYVVDYGGDNDNVLLAADGDTIPNIIIDTAGGEPCGIDSFELSYKNTNVDGSEWQVYEPRETDPFVFVPATGALTVVASEPFAYTLKLTATTSNGETAESGEFEATGTCGISAAKSSFDINVEGESSYVIDGAQPVLEMPYVGSSADACRPSRYSLYIQDDAEPLGYREHPDFETDYTDAASEELIRFKIIESKSLLVADYEYLLGIRTRDDTLVVDTSRTYALSVICGVATIEPSTIDAQSSYVMDGAQPALSFPTFTTKSDDCPIASYQIISEVVGDEHTIAPEFDQGWTEDSGRITFKLDPAYQAAKATYTYYVKAVVDVVAERVTSSPATFDVVCGDDTIVPSALSDTEYTIDGNVPSFSFTPYETHSDDCPITRYELLADGAAVSADFQDTNTVSGSEVTVSLLEDLQTTKADYTWYVKAYNEGSGGVEGSDVSEARVFQVICGSDTYIAPSSIDPSTYEIDNN